MAEKTDAARVMKQIGFLSIPIIIVLGIVGVILYSTVLQPEPPPPPPPPPSEEKPINIIQTAFLRGQVGKVDTLIQLRNPNEREGASSFAYTIGFLGSNGEVLDTYIGQSYILPGETKYVTNVGLGVVQADRVASIEVEISDSVWEEIPEYTGITLVTKGKQFFPSNVVTGPYVTGAVSNATNFDFRLVLVNVVLYDRQQNVIGINTTTLDNVKAQTERSFQVTWFQNGILGDVAAIDAEAQTNLFDQANLVPILEGSFLPSFQYFDRVVPGMMEGS